MTYSNEYYLKVMKPYREKNRDHITEVEKKRQARLRKAVLLALGEKCAICNRENLTTQLIPHKKDGKSHSRSYKYTLAHLDEYVLLCRPHHASIHRLKNEGRLEVMIEILQNLL